MKELSFFLLALPTIQFATYTTSTLFSASGWLPKTLVSRGIDDRERDGTPHVSKQHSAMDHSPSWEDVSLVLGSTCFKDVQKLRKQEPAAADHILRFMGDFINLQPEERRHALSFANNRPVLRNVLLSDSHNMDRKLAATTLAELSEAAESEHGHQDIEVGLGKKGGLALAQRGCAVFKALSRMEAQYPKSNLPYWLRQVEPTASRLRTVESASWFPRWRRKNPPPVIASGRRASDGSLVIDWKHGGREVWS